MVPTLRAVYERLREDPKQYPTKQGGLGDCRAAVIKVANVPYRLVFQVIERERLVRILAFEKRGSSRAYEIAKRVQKTAAASAKPLSLPEDEPRPGLS